MSPLPLAPAEDPPRGVSYPLVLTGSDGGPVRLAMGILMALSLFLLVVPVTAQALLGLVWIAVGRPGSFAEYRAAGLGYRLPEGIVATHLALAMLAVISLVLVRHLHGREARWLVSVQPGWRLRYLLICLPLAVVVLNAVLWASFGLLGTPVFDGGQPGWPVFLAIICLTSPVQALAEEFFFRGYVLQAIGSATGRAWAGVVGSALLFAVLHGLQNPALFADRFAFGLVAGWLVVATGGLEAGIAAHVVNNLFAFGYGLFTGGVAVTKATSAIGWDKAFFDVLGFAVFAAVAWWVGRRMHLATTTPS